MPDIPTGASSSLIIYCLVYTLAAADEYWVLDGMRSLYGIELAIYAALLQNASWPIQIFYYRKAREQYLIENKTERIVTPQMYKSYTILGVLSAFITLTRTMGITSLPASIYVICANTEIVFETIMTKIVLGREVSWLQLISVGLVLSGVLVSLYDPSSNAYAQASGVSQSTLLVGVMTSLLSRFASSLNTVLADRFLGKDAKSRMGVLECSLANSIIPCCVLPLALAVIPEYKSWTTQLAGGHSAAARVFIAFLSLVVTASKHADRLAKFTIVSMTSTMFFAAVDSNMKVVAGIGSFLFFREDVYWPQVLGFIFIFFALIVMFIDKKQKIEAAKAKEAEEAAKYEERKTISASRSSKVGLSKSSSSSSFQIAESEAGMNEEVKSPMAPMEPLTEEEFQDLENPDFNNSRLSKFEDIYLDDVADLRMSLVST